MHSYAWVILPEEPTDIRSAVDDVMSRYYAGDQGIDFWEIGGRWTGVIEKIDPRLEPMNYKGTCWFCSGTGVATYGHTNTERSCPNCLGSGRGMKHPKEWSQTAVNYRRIAGLDLEKVALVPSEVFTADDVFGCGFFVVTPEPGSNKIWDDWISELKTILARHPDGIVVVVDYHI